MTTIYDELLLELPLPCRGEDPLPLPSFADVPSVEAE